MYVYMYVVYMYVCIILLKHALLVTAIIALWQLVHLGTLMYGYMLLAFRFQTKLKLALEQQV